MAPQDTFIDDEDDTCPLCIEEFDLSDRGFRPCPCGYQICQFCFHNLRNNLSGLCPACRRPYDEKSIQWKLVTAEEEAEFRANIQKNQKKRATEQRQKEVQKREADKENRKNLVGVRVVQKNLVYVTGLTPTVREDELLKTLRRPEFFGQYGGIQKISISNRKSSDGQATSLGIYVTFDKKEDASRCIQAVNGSQNGERVLRAQLGTTKYCSAWLRHEQCSNRQCMFLHELGDEEDSYTRQDLSSLNSVHTQRPSSHAPGGPSSRAPSRAQPAAAQPPPAVSQPMARTASKEGSEAGDGPALPATANWARNNPQRSRRGSQATSGAASSPAVSASLPVTSEAQDNMSPQDSTTPSNNPSKQAGADASPTKSVAERPDQPDWSWILKALAAIPDSIFAVPEDMSEPGPPAFDVNGGAKRRAMREEEDNRLSEQGEPSIEQPDPAEDEPESGSHALGGEPEDREQSHESVTFDQRRNGAQPPIQRSATDALFGPSLSNFGANTAANPLGSRSMTPQQPPFGRAQGSFADQMPPGLHNQQSSLFQGQGQNQGQGHSRQQSRFSFASENTNSTNVKLATDPRILAQQSSMMPSTAYRSQPSGPYFGGAGNGNMPGPPPGLKSTGTPPVSGNMFGQGHGFGGSGFGAAAKDNTNELLQSLIRGRGAASAQAHDAGKREYFSTFSTQIPSSTSSTPAPAPATGLLASLYGSQPGGFQDLGSKQKKKGKKHRHANTSSFGGSGLVDLADPSILQARMQHQQQGSNTQGLFGGQTQDDDLIPFDEASTSVDALVADSDVTTPELSHALLPRDKFAPSVPPGLGFGHVQPPAPSTERQDLPCPPGLSGVRSQTPSTPQPVTPAMKKSAIRTTPPEEAEPSICDDADAKKHIQDLALKSGLSKDIAAQAAETPKGKSLLQDEDFPALDSKKLSTPPKATPSVPPKRTPASKASQEKKAAVPTPTKAQPTKKSAKPEKRPVPGTLDIDAATKASSQATPPDAKDSLERTASSAVSGQAQTAKSQNTTVAPSSSTPTTASVSSPSTRAGPKTLRLVQTPKIEAPPVTLPSAAAASIRSAGIGGPANRPATPASEIISENTSIVSTSVPASRASSPPPSKVGSASLRGTTKSQQRKQRKGASKEAAAQIAETKSVEQEVEIAPILGRKKKQKKETKTSVASPVPTRPQTPVGQRKEATPPKEATKQTPEKKEAEEPSTVTAPAPAPETKENEDGTKSASGVDTSIRLNESTKTTVLTPDFVNPASETQPEEPVDDDLGDVPDIAEVLQALVSEGKVADTGRISFFSNLAGSVSRSEIDEDTPVSLPPTLKSIITKEDEEQLSAFKSVRKIVNNQTVLLTPNGDCLLNLTDEETVMFLELQDRLRADSARPTAFSAPRHAPASGFTLVKNRAVPNGTPSFFPAGPDNYPSDPVGKMHREEAIGCINQHVLPSLDLGSYKMAGSNNSSQFTKNVNLQQLAPWIYPGADSGAGAGDFANMPGPQHLDSAYGSYEGPDGMQSPAIGSTPLMSIDESETVWSQAKKQHDAIDKKFRQLQAKNRRLVDMGQN